MSLSRQLGYQDHSSSTLSILTDTDLPERRGRIYTTNFEHDCILLRNTDGTFELMVHDPRILSPDGIFCTPTHVYCTLGQWNRLASFNNGQDKRHPPYHLIRFPIEPVAAYNAEGGVNG